jgi:hypothetical protein
MPRFHFDIIENGRVIADEEGREFDNVAAVRREAVETGASIARDVFMSGKGEHVVVDVRTDGMPILKVSISLVVEDLSQA